MSSGPGFLARMRARLNSRRARHDSLETDRRYDARLESELADVVGELADSVLLQSLASTLFEQNDQQVIYEKIMDAAVGIMRSDFASMQVFHPERGELRLIAFRGFNPQAASFWEWVRADSSCSCGIALRTRTRVVEPDIARSPAIVGTPDHATYLHAGIRAVQSTPLIARDGSLVGMLSTHWKTPHQPEERELALLDRLAQQAAYVIERSRADEVLRKLAAIVETSDDAIIGKDLNGIISSWNRAAEQLFGYTALEAIGRPVTMLMPPDRVDEESRLLECLRRGERIEHYETVRWRKDGTLLDISLSVSPLLDRAGKVIGASKIARDITDRKRAERELREAERRKEEFLAMASHELRNPLAPIRNAVTLLQITDDKETRRQACAILDRQVGHMTRLVEDMLDISRISRGEVEVDRQEVDLGAVVRAAVETSRPLVEAAGHRLDIALPGGPVSVLADSVRLAQVVSNLLNNAAKYTPSGGRIGIEVSKTNGTAALSVRDNGIGISPADLPQLFHMYTQLEAGRRRAPGGLGVGLAVARQLVELHGGTIEARSKGPGQGSEFTVHIPLAASSRRPGPPG